MKAQFNTKTLLAVAIAALLPAGTALAAGTSGGTVNFSGKVVTSACAISAGSANIDVDMGEVRTATLKTAGSVASTAKAFAITLEDCEIADTSASTDENPIAATTVAVTFTGTLDMNSLSGSGTIELASIKSAQLGGNLYLDLFGLDISTSDPKIQTSVAQVTENGVTKVLINYETVPEPATATLSLLGLGGLLLRRKRQ